jgi:hypothetical protein
MSFNARRCSNSDETMRIWGLPSMSASGLSLAQEGAEVDGYWESGNRDNEIPTKRLTLKPHPIQGAQAKLAKECFPSMNILRRTGEFLYAPLYGLYEAATLKWRSLTGSLRSLR